MLALDSSVVDERLLAFERAMEFSSSADLETFLPPVGDPSREHTVCELVRVDLDLRWSRGEKPNLDHYLHRFPELKEPSALAAVAYEDYRQRIMSGQAPARDDYARRYQLNVSDWPGPEAATAPLGPGTEEANSSRRALHEPTLRADVQPLVEVEREFNDVSDATRQALKTASTLPEVGQTLLGFRLAAGTGPRGVWPRLSSRADRTVTPPSGAQAGHWASHGKPGVGTFATHKHRAGVLDPSRPDVSRIGDAFLWRYDALDCVTRACREIGATHWA